MIVRAESNGARVETMAALPDARTTIIVSPTARPKPSTIAAAMPGAAAGSTTRSVVCDGVEPSASAAVAVRLRHGAERVLATP